MNKKISYVMAGGVKEIRVRVVSLIESGMDIYGPMFVTASHGLCIPMVDGKSFYDYALVSAEDLAGLEESVNTLAAVGFDLLHGVVVYQDLEDGQYLQWMCKMREFEKASARKADEYVTASC